MKKSSFHASKCSLSRADLTPVVARLKPEHQNRPIMSHVKTHFEEGVCVVEFSESSILDQSEIDSIGQELYFIAEQSAGSQIIVDLEHVEFLSSAMIGVFIRFKLKLRKSDSELKLCNAKPVLLEMLKLTKLDKVFDIHKSRLDALNAFGNLAN